MRLLLRLLRSAAFALLGLVVLALLGRAGAWVYDQVTPRTYEATRGDLERLQADGVPAGAVERLRPMAGRAFPSQEALFAAYRHRVGADVLERHRAAFQRHLHTQRCWATEATRRIHYVRDSRGHRLYNRFRWEPVLPGAAGPEVPTNLAFLPGGGAIVLGKKGDVAFYDDAWQQRGQFRIPEAFTGQGDQGTTGIALAPDFPASAHFYVTHVGRENRYNYVQRFTYGPDPQAVLQSRTVILRTARDDEHPLHGISAAAFAPDGTLQVLIGAPSSHLAQRPWALQGVLVALRPGTGPQGGYTPAAGWLRSLLHGTVPPVMAWGLRSPYSAARWGERWVIGDVGGDGPHSYEEINLYDGGMGQNFGRGRCSQPAWHAGFSPPIIAYRRDEPKTWADLPGRDTSGGNRSVIVGPVYPGGPEDRYSGALDGRLLYADFFLGFVRAAHVRDSDGQVSDDVLITQQKFLTNMTVAPEGHVYATAGFGPHAVLRLTGPRARTDH